MEELDAKQQNEEIIKEALDGAFDILNLQSRDAKDAENMVKRLAEGIISTAHEITGVKTIYTGKVLSVDEIMREYKFDPEAAKAKYEGKKATVSGIIENSPLEQKSGCITVNIIDCLFAEYDYNCTCVLPSWNKNLISELRPGRRLTVAGIWSYMENDLAIIAWLNDCVAVNVEDAENSEELQKHLDRTAKIMKAKEEYDAEHSFDEGDFLTEEEEEKIQSLVFADYEHMRKNH